MTMYVTWLARKPVDFIWVLLEASRTARCGHLHGVVEFMAASSFKDPGAFRFMMENFLPRVGFYSQKFLIFWAFGWLERWLLDKFAPLCISSFWSCLLFPGWSMIWNYQRSLVRWKWKTALDFGNKSQFHSYIHANLFWISKWHGHAKNNYYT